MAEVRTTEAGAARGSGYPAFSLQEALTRARAFWDAERRNAAPVSAAVAHWGYGEKSSGGKRTIAALIQYGLLQDVTGKDGSRLVKLTERALDILLSPTESEPWRNGIRAAATSPKIYSDLLARWAPRELPSDASLQYYLLKERNFNPNAVIDFIKDFRDTITFAGLDRDEVDRLSEPETARVEEVPVASNNVLPAGVVAAMTRLRAPSAAPTPPHIRQDTFTLDEGQVVLQWPAKLSPSSYQDFKDWIELQMRKIARAVVADNPPPTNS
jgi:hypothetical protein